ncbi:hypothetical protein IFR05_015072 [Cadophora sp. M221]|nr:hypothetical protein IFR05_015072 [Cadophora sp. M221]
MARPTPNNPDDGLAAFNKVMNMETFSLIDDQHQLHLKTDLNLREIFKTRLVIVDSSQKPQDPLHQKIHECLQNFRYWRLSRQEVYDVEKADSPPRKPESRHRSTHQDSNCLAEWSARFVVALVASLLLVVPLVILTFQSNKKLQLVTVLISILVFSLVLSTSMKTANFQTVTAVAAYAAVVSVFVSGAPGTDM